MKGKQAEQYTTFQHGWQMPEQLAAPETKASENSVPCNQYQEQDRSIASPCTNDICSTDWKPQQKY